MKSFVEAKQRPDRRVREVRREHLEHLRQRVRVSKDCATDYLLYLLGDIDDCADMFDYELSREVPRVPVQNEDDCGKHEPIAGAFAVASSLGMIAD